MYLTLFLLLLLTVVALAILSFLTSRQHQNFLRFLMLEEKKQNQSLLNQLRSGDPMTLHALQAATGQTPPSFYDGAPSGVTHEGIQYQADLESQGLTLQDIDDELYASGWDQSVTTSDTGGTPVNFERP
jgi:hypothetical protein